MSCAGCEAAQEPERSGKKPEMPDEEPLQADRNASDARNPPGELIARQHPPSRSEGHGATRTAIS